MPSPIGYMEKIDTCTILVEPILRTLWNEMKRLMGLKVHQHGVKPANCLGHSSAIASMK